eukprot:1156381-Pelagomonas_calceolata.AAC.4
MCACRVLAFFSRASEENAEHGQSLKVMLHLSPAPDCFLLLMVARHCAGLFPGNKQGRLKQAALMPFWDMVKQSCGRNSLQSSHLAKTVRFVEKG